jgi:hypothetical protein
MSSELRSTARFGEAPASDEYSLRISGPSEEYLLATRSGPDILRLSVLLIQRLRVPIKVLQAKRKHTALVPSEPIQTQRISSSTRKRRSSKMAIDAATNTFRILIVGGGIAGLATV